MCFSTKKMRIKDSKWIFGNQLRRKSLKHNARSSFLAQLTLSLLIQYDKAKVSVTLAWANWILFAPKIGRYHPTGQTCGSHRSDRCG
jgi:hypothetical protein